MTFAFVPEKLIAWNYEMSSAKYIDEQYKGLPVVGGWFGGKEGNFETFMQVQADVVIESTSMYYSDEKSIELADSINKNCGGVPVVIVHDYLDRYDETIEFFGKLFNKSEKANELLAFYNKIMEISERASQIPQDKRVTVYVCHEGMGKYIPCRI
jgi:iron complex transport system substrate-binding protein